MKKKTIAILMGGKSAEHRISLISARNIMKALDRKKYTVLPIGITPDGVWYTLERTLFRNPDDPEKIALRTKEKVLLDGQRLLHLHSGKRRTIDVIFPALHGTYGEDGTMQGLLELMDLPYVGPNVLGSAVAMDKDIAKRLLRDAGIAVAPWVTVHAHEKAPSYASIQKKLGTPLFVKPANAGSSVGVSKAETAKEYVQALKKAFTYDTKVLIEQGINGREIECAILGNEDPQASVPGEIIPTGHAFYSYASKYLDADGARLEAPAKLSKTTIKNLQKTAIKAFQTLGCEGLSRVDFFVTPSRKLYVNEINTIPGFTTVSMYPKLWELSGISYKKLIDTLIQLAISRHKRTKKLKTTF